MRNLLFAGWLLLLTGCGSTPSPAPVMGGAAESADTGTEIEHPLVLLVIDDPPLAEEIARQWKQRQNQPLEVRQAGASGDGSELDKIEADLMIFPSAMLGELAESKRIAPLPQGTISSPVAAQSDVLSLVRLRETVWGDKTMAFSLGSPQLVVMYRADLFEKLSLSPPRTWAEYQSTAAILADASRLKAAGANVPAEWCGAVEPLVGDWAAQMLLARAAAYARHPGYYSTLFDYETMQPLIDSPPFARALGELAAANKSGLAAGKTLDAHKCRSLLLTGKCGMTISWPSPPGSEGEATAGEIGFCELPGAVELYNVRQKQWEQRPAAADRRVPLLGVAGRMVAVSSRATHPSNAFAAAAWIAGREMSGLISPASRFTTLHRTSQLKQPQPWVDRGVSPKAARQYASVVQESQSHGAWLRTISLPAHRDYNAALADAVRTAVEGKTTAADALATAATKWQEITARRGKESQGRAYRRSMGLAE